MTALEALLNASIGLVVSWTLTAFVLGYTPSQAVSVTMMFFAASFTRSWLIRKAFKAWES
jgi:hypothetical protein